MTWDYPYRWGGPVLAWELHRGRDRRSILVLAIGFFVMCLLHFGIMAFRFDANLESTSRQWWSESRWQGKVVAQNEAKMLFAAQYLGKFFPIHLFVLLLVTPALTASALGQEKEKDTLSALFGTELADREIVRGKVLGRYAQLLRFMLYSLPLPCAIAGMARIELTPVLICYLHACVITFALTGICMFSSVITRRTRDAIMACYSIIIIILLISLTLLGDRPLPTWLNPVEVCVGLSSYPFTNISPSVLIIHLIVFFGLGFGFVLASCSLLRWACLRQLEDRSQRWKWIIRQGVGSDPILWRESNILGIAPLPALRGIPTWLGAIGCAVFSVSMIGGLVNSGSHGQLVQYLMRFNLSDAWQLVHRLNGERLQSDVILMGVILIFFAAITVLVRCAGAISEEKRLKTWEDLLMTGIPVEQIARSKMWGILRASWLFICCFALPWMLFACLDGWDGLRTALILFGITWLVVLLAAYIGIGMSMSSQEFSPMRARSDALRNEWQSNVRKSYTVP
ncbi:MAG: hypothetical protein U0796_00575 [Gemmatales bacterium]